MIGQGYDLTLWDQEKTCVYCQNQSDQKQDQLYYDVPCVMIAKIKL